MLSPAQLLSILYFMPLLRIVSAGRSAIRVEAYPRHEHSQVNGLYARVRHGLGTGADRYQLDIDAERGLILAVRVFVGREPFQIIEAVKIVIDEPIDEALFDFPTT